MPTTQLIIAGLTVQAGPLTLLAPTAAPASFSQVVIAFDLSLALSPTDITIWYAPDGVTFQPLVVAGGCAPGSTVGITATWPGTTWQGSSPTMKVTATNNGLAFVSTGGSLSVS